MSGRLYLTDREWREMYEAQDGKCAACGEAADEFHADHSIPNHWAPGKPDQLLCVPCHKQKTRRDAKAIAKVKRLNGETKSQWERRKMGAQRRAWPSRKFSKGEGAPRRVEDFVRR